MIYYDYIWDLHEDRIILDVELNIDALKWNPGDYFRVEKINGKVQLIKIDPILKFIEDGVRNDKK